MKISKFNKKHCGMAAVAIATIGLSSCSNELKEGDLINDGNISVNGISLAKNPNVYAWSGDQDFTHSRSMISNLNSVGASDEEGFVYGDYNNYDYSYGRAQTNANEWGTDNNNGIYKNYPVPAEITEEELQKVLAVFNEKGKTSYKPLVDWKNFFVQQVYCGPNGDKMTELACVVDFNFQVTSWYPEYTVEYSEASPMNVIVNNFNGGKYNGNANQGAMLMFHSSTLDWSWKSTQGGGQRFGNWRMEYIDGAYYIGFDFQSAKQGSEANENEYAERDYIYNDWIIKIVPGIGVTVTPPEDPTVGGNGNNGNGVIENPENPDNGTVVKTTSEVEVNLAINDYDPTASTEVGIADIVTKLSIHVRAATNVKVEIPIPGTYLCDADDIIILEKHLEDFTSHGGLTTENVVEYSVNDNKVELHSEIDFENGKIKVWTVGINEDVIEYCIAKNGDGINFEIWNYFNNSAFEDFGNAKAELQEYLNKATIKFEDSYPDYYINAFNVTENGDKFDWDCIVSIVEDQESQFGVAKQDYHLNGSEFNQIFKNNDFDGEDGAHDHDFLKNKIDKGQD